MYFYDPFYKTLSTYEIYFFCQDATSVVEFKSWPNLIDTDDLSKRKLAAVYRAPTAEMICYLDFSVSTTGMLAGIKVRSTRNVTSPLNFVLVIIIWYRSRNF